MKTQDQGLHALLVPPPDRMVVGLDTFGRLVSDCARAGAEDPWQAAINLANTGTVGYTKHEQALLEQRTAARNEVAELIASEVDREARLVNLLVAYPDADPEDIAEAQEMLEVCRRGTVRLHEILHEHESAITHLRTAVVDHWRTVDTTMTVISKALGRPVAMLHVASGRERRSQSHCSTAAASKGDSSDPPGRPRAPGEGQERLERLIDWPALEGRAA